jgi:hypothetical protein
MHEFVPIIAEPEARVGNCYVNVEQKVARSGGALVYGWAVWLGDFVCEGEHHAVWENENEDLIDITPNQIGANQVLFIPDNRYLYDNKLIGNIRINIGDNPVVDHFILLSEMKDFLVNTATRLDDERMEFPNKVIQNMYNHYDSLRNNALIYLKEQGKFGSLCYCGSSKTYSICHGKDLAKSIESDKNAVVKFNSQYR